VSTLRRTLGWIAIGAINGTSLGAVLGTCLGWFTVGCNVPGNAVAMRTARIGAALGGIAGILAGASWAVWKSSPWRFRRLTVFVGVSGFLFIAMILPAVALVTNAGARIKSSGSLKQIGFALHSYHNQHGSFPPAAFPLGGEPPEKRLSWFVAILPYLERQ
jgi:hypothetical protein